MVTSRAERIEEIVKRAKLRAPRGFASVDELGSLSLGRSNLTCDERFYFPIDLTRSLRLGLSSTYRIVGSGECDIYRQRPDDAHVPSKRYWIGKLLELAVGDEVLFTMPFPAISREMASIMKPAGNGFNANWRRATTSSFHFSMRQCLPHGLRGRHQWVLRADALMRSSSLRRVCAPRGCGALRRPTFPAAPFHGSSPSAHGRRESARSHRSGALVSAWVLPPLVADTFRGCHPAYR